MNYDDYGEVINGQSTYEDISYNLKKGKAVLIGWTDEDMTHFDILFTYQAHKEGTTQGGIRRDDLFVSIMRKGAFGFNPAQDDTHHGYYEEKFGFMGSPTREKLAELINGVKKQVNTYEKY